MASNNSDASADRSRGDPMEQVRELLFGETKRSAERNVQSLDAKLEALRADFLARFSDLEARLVDLARETERERAASIDAIGGAIAQLGATVQGMSSAPGLSSRAKGK